MKRILIVGAGTAGTMMARHLLRKIDPREWKITVVDKDENHYYQPGFLFLPFGIYTDKDVIKPKKKFFSSKIEYLQANVDLIEPQKNKIVLENGTDLEYHIIIIATGTDIASDEVAGLTDSGWQVDAFDFYTYKGASALARKLETWPGGKLALHIAEMPIKCPVAPLEFAFHADAFFTKKKMREKVEIEYVTPLSGAFTKPIAAGVFGNLLAEKNIKLVPDFNTERVDPNARQLISYDQRKVDYDLLVTIPTNMGDALMERSGMGDELNYVPTDKHSLQSKDYENIFVIGDATDLPSSKAGAVAHFEAEILTRNIMSFIRNQPLTASFDGHANCFIESGFGKGILIDFNYEYEPVQGRFPIPLLGPMALLKETRLNHWGKLAFKYIYWNMLLNAIPLPGITTHMSKMGKKLNI